MYATHSIHYRNLASYFLVFAIYNEKNVSLSWDDMAEYAELLDISVVPVLYRGVYNEERIKACFTGKSAFRGSVQEGYVVRLASDVSWCQHRFSIAKFVREDHVQTSHGWMHRRVVPNELKPTERTHDEGKPARHPTRGRTDLAE